MRFSFQNCVSPTHDTLKRRNSERTSIRKYIRRAILFTKVNSAPYAKPIQDLGGYVVDTPQLGDVLICDKISRTFKFLYAISKGIPIVTSQWLDASIKSGVFVPTDPYLVADKISEKRFHFSLKQSLGNLFKIFYLAISIFSIVFDWSTSCKHLAEFHDRKCPSEAAFHQLPHICYDQRATHHRRNIRDRSLFGWQFRD